MRYVRLVALMGGVVALSRCGHPEGPAVAASPFFNATVDGTSWVPDTASCLVLQATGTAVLITASRLVSAQEEQGTVIGFSGFPAPRQFALADILSPAFAYFKVTRANQPYPLLYVSGNAQPGLLSITAVTDSMVAGTFTFEAATIPDSTAHRIVTGQFRLRYEVARAP
jgi:hypothetical protein